MANKKKRTGKNINKPATEQQPAQASPQPKQKETSSAAIQDMPAPQWRNIYTVSLLAVFILMGFMSFWFGLSGDEVDMNEYGKIILNYFTSFGSDKTVFNIPQYIDRDGVLMYYGGFFDLVCAIVNKVSPFEEYTTRHLLNAWAGFLAIFFSARIVAILADKRWATLCIWLMFLSPFFLGHSMNNPKDIPLAAGYIAAIFFMIRFFERFPNVKKTDYLWLILSIGITINIRVAGILLIPYLFVYVGILYMINISSSKDSFKLNDYVKPVLIIAVLGYFAGSLFWPYGLKNPLSNPLTALGEMSDFKINLGQIWEGEKVMSGLLPQSYLIKSFFITNTYAVLAGIIAFFVFIKAAAQSNKKHIIFFVAFTALFPLFYIIYKKSNVYHAWRHVLFIFPSAMVMAALGWSYLNSFIAKRFNKTYVGLALAFVLLIEPVIFIIPTFPNTVTYHNDFVGGVKGAYGNYEVDYYYNSVKQCVDYFVENELPQLEDRDSIILATNSVHLMVPYMKAHPKVKPVYVRFYERDMQDWDYAIFHIALIPLEEIQAESWRPPTTIYTAEVKGKALSALIKRPSKNDLKAYNALQSGNREEALMYFKKYLEEDSANINILTMTARLHMEMNMPDSAYEYAVKAYNLDNSGIETQRVYAMALSYRGENEKAHSLFEQIVKERPDYVMGYYYMAMTEMNMGKDQDAINNFNKVAAAAQQQDPSLSAECYRRMGDIFKRNGDDAQANTLYSKAAEIKR